MGAFSFALVFVGVLVGGVMMFIEWFGYFVGWGLVSEGADVLREAEMAMARDGYMPLWLLCLVLVLLEAFLLCAVSYAKLMVRFMRND